VDQESIIESPVVVTLLKQRTLGPMTMYHNECFIVWLLIAFAVLIEGHPTSALTPQRAAFAIASANVTRCSIGLALDTPGLTHAPEPPTGRIRIMAARYRDLENALVGYNRSHVPLVSDASGVLAPAGTVDDFGAYYLIPQIATRFGLSLRRSIDVFYLSILLTALALGIFGCSFALRTTVCKLWSAAELVLVTALAYSYGDVYILLAATAIAIVPLTIYAIATRSVAFVATVVFASGAAISTANAIRSYSGIGVLLFVLCLMLTRFIGARRHKVFLVLCLLCGLTLPQLWFTSALSKRDRFLRAVCPDYPALSSTHVFWHAAYAGFGFLRNDVVTGYDDRVTYDKVQSIAPGTVYGSAEYERILRREVYLILRRYPRLVLYTVAAKLGVILALFLLFSNVGLIGARIAPKPLGLEIAFWLGIAFNGLFGILIVPLVAYLLGLIAFATLYGVVSLDFAFEKKFREGACQSRLGLRASANTLT